ncbi:hypothetical protein D3C73_1468560 [compost metagenome]
MISFLWPPLIAIHMVGDRTDLGVGVHPENVLGVSIIRKLSGTRLDHHITSTILKFPFSKPPS